MKPNKTTDYTGAQCALEYGQCILLGDILETYTDEQGIIRCRVRHFSGRDWPFRPELDTLEILERDYADD